MVSAFLLKMPAEVIEPGEINRGRKFLSQMSQKEKIVFFLHFCLLQQQATK